MHDAKVLAVDPNLVCQTDRGKIEELTSGIANGRQIFKGITSDEEGSHAAMGSFVASASHWHNLSRAEHSGYAFSENFSGCLAGQPTT